ncbi:MAG: BatD family protein [Verrucomicrobiota bacterium]
MRFAWVIGFILLATHSFADVSVSASVDQARVSFGETVTLTISLSGTHNGGQPAIPKIDGLSFVGPSVNTSVSIVNGTMSQSVSLAYQVTPTRIGEFVIPALDVNVAGKVYKTAPIKLIVDKPGAQPEMSQSLFAKVRMNSQQVYLGQTAPLDVLVFARANMPVRGLSSFNADAEGLGYKYSREIKSGAQTINGESFNVYLIEGAIAPVREGKLNFGPCVIKVQLQTQSRSRNMFEEMMGRVEVREVPITLEAVPLEVLPLPTTGRPADFTGAVGEWNLTVEAKPTEVAVGDPITVTVKIAGNGNIDTVPAIQLKGLEDFKTYDPTTKTTKNELNTTGERVLQQVLIAKDTSVTQLPAVQLPYFDPVAKAYKVSGHAPIPLKIKAGGQAAVLTGSQRARPQEKLGQDIVYLKGERGELPERLPPIWLLNLVPVLGLAGALAWKWRRDRLAGNVAYARRSRAARNARQALARNEPVQRVLQEYLGDRLNIPAAGITAAVADEHRLPAAVREIFEACDAAQFAGVQTDVNMLKQKLERVIDELENATL